MGYKYHAFKFRKKLNGIQVSCFLNGANNINGAQIASVFNVCQVLNGVQIGGILNLTTENFNSGFQISSGANFSKSTDKNVIQVAFICNLGQSQGTQFAIFNYSFSLGMNHSEEIIVEEGKQIGLFNIADNDSILQIGLLNFKAKYGTQIGLINIAKDNKNKIGLFNICKISKFKYSLTTYNISRRIGISSEVFNGNLYTGLSYSFFDKNEKKYCSLGIYKGLKFSFDRIDFLIDSGIEYNLSRFEKYGLISRIMTNFDQFDAPTISRKHFESASSFIGISSNYKFNNLKKYCDDNLYLNFIFGISFVF